MTFWTYRMQTFAVELWIYSPYQHQNRKVSHSGRKYLKRGLFELLNCFTWPAFTLFLSSLCHLIEESAASLLEMNESQKCCILPHMGSSEANQVWIAQAHQPCQAHVATNSEDWTLLVAIFTWLKSQSFPSMALEPDRWGSARQQSSFSTKW